MEHILDDDELEKDSRRQLRTEIETYRSWVRLTGVLLVVGCFLVVLLGLNLVSMGYRMEETFLGGAFFIGAVLGIIMVVLHYKSFEQDRNADEPQFSDIPDLTKVGKAWKAGACSLLFICSAISFILVSEVYRNMSYPPYTKGFDEEMLEELPPPVDEAPIEGFEETE